MSKFDPCPVIRNHESKTTQNYQIASHEGTVDGQKKLRNIEQSQLIAR